MKPGAFEAFFDAFFRDGPELRARIPTDRGTPEQHDAYRAGARAKATHLPACVPIRYYDRPAFWAAGYDGRPFPA